MAIIPTGQQFHTLSSTVSTLERGSAYANASRESFTMQDIIDTISATGGAIDGSGTARTIPFFTDSNTIGDSPLIVSTFVPGDGLAQIKFTDGYRFIINRPATVTSGDQEYAITQDDVNKVSFGWDDDGGGFGFLYNWAGFGWRIGAAGNNPMLEIVTTAGSESVNLHKQVEFKDYGSGTYTGTAAYTLAVDASGNVIEEAAGGGGVPFILGGTNFANSLKVGDTTTGTLSAAEYNVGVGVASMDAITSADSCTAVGWSSLGTLTSGGDNTAMGSLAGNGISSGQNNVNIGAKSCQSGNTNYSTGVGARTLRFGAAGADNNVAVGFSAGIQTEGAQNTMLGAQAGGNLTTGANNTIVGYDAEPSSATVSNEITLGNSSVSVIRAAVTSITSLSDERDKKDIKDITYGLDFVSKLQPREFVWDNRAEKRVVLDDEGNVESETEHYSDNKNKKDFGFIAQEVQVHDDDTLRLIYDANPDKLEMSYGKLVPILVKAIQDLSAELDKKQDK